jgi:hypothetical protein
VSTPSVPKTTKPRYPRPSVVQPSGPVRGAQASEQVPELAGLARLQRPLGVGEPAEHVGLHHQLRAGLAPALRERRRAGGSGSRQHLHPAPPENCGRGAAGAAPRRECARRDGDPARRAREVTRSGRRSARSSSRRSWCRSRGWPSAGR